MEKTKKAPNVSFKKLRGFNIIMAILHAVQGTLMLVLSNDFSLPVTTSFLKFNPALNKILPFQETAFDLRIGPMIAAFLFLSALAHLMVSLPGINNWYVNNLNKKINPARWIEYSFSSSLMIVVIAMLFGMYDGVSLILMFVLNAMMILFGWMMELYNQGQEKTKWLPYWFGVIAGVVPWIAILIYLVGAGSVGDVPTFVYWIFGTILVSFNIFAINMVLQYRKKGKWANYLYGEYTYIILSLVAKSLLAWQIWGGTLRPV